jgi:hypothetical protein
MNAALSQYRGSEKHKNRPSRGPKGTLCPEWTHITPEAGYASDPFLHAWSQTEAHTLFAAATACPRGRKSRYATKNGVAFEAKPTGDGTWHGFPIPWKHVPPSIKHGWLQQGMVTTRQIKALSSGNLHRASASDA